MFCTKCGRESGAGQKFCINCGAELPVSSSPPDKKEETTAIPYAQEPKNSAEPKGKNLLSAYKLQNIDLPTAERHIKNAWVAALISAGLTAIVVALGILDVSSWFDVALVLLFAFGIFRKNRIAAAGMFIYFIISKIILIGQADETGSFNIGSVFAALAFLHYFYLGMAGTIRYHQLIPKEQRRHGMVFGVVVGSLATLFIVLLLAGLLPGEANPQDIVLQADYQEGYKAGYVDGRAPQSEIGDSYVQIATEERRGAYDLGYLVGFSEGCKEGGYDCNEVDRAINEALNDANLPTDGSIQLIPNAV